MISKGKEFFAALSDLEREKGISEEVFLEALSTALASAYKKQFLDDVTGNVEVKLNPEKETIRFFLTRTVVDSEEIADGAAGPLHLRGGVLGINIGKNAVTPIENAISDFRICLAKSYDRADYIAVNISSPNTKNLCSLQAEAPLRELLGALRDERNRIIETEGAPYKPIAVKLAPDLENDAILRAVDIIVEHEMDAVIATNTTIDHSSVQGLPNWNETGGLSGRPLMARSTECLAMITDHLKGKLPVIASGGVMSGDDAVVKMQAGASLVQLYTGFIYTGPALIAQCAEAIAAYQRG